MFWKSFFKFIKRWGIIGLLFSPFIILSFLNLSDTSTSNYANFKEKIEFLSWIFSSIMALVTFATLFLAFTYENKLIVASKNHKNILKPYTLSTDELRNIIINYQNSTQKDKILTFIYNGFIIVAFFSMLIWGAAVGVYTNYRFSFTIDLSIESLLVFGIYVFYIILFLIFVLLTIAIKLILLNKDPLGSGYLPRIENICDVNYLVENNGDIGEFLIKNPIIIEFFKNHAGSGDPKYDAIIKVPINTSNLRYVIKLYDGNDKLLITFFGKTKNKIINNEIAGYYSKEVTTKFERHIYQVLESDKMCYGICKIIDNNFKVVAKFYLIRNVINNKNLLFSISKKISSDKGIDHDGKLIEINETHSDFCKYQIENGSID